MIDETTVSGGVRHNIAHRDQIRNGRPYHGVATQGSCQSAPVTVASREMLELNIGPYGALGHPEQLLYGMML